MHSPVPEYLADVLAACTDESPAAIALTTVDDAHHGAGDLAHRFAIQSMSKPFAYAVALERRGWEAVHEKVDVEPSGEAFNEISLDPRTGRPHNPMINAGAIAISGLIGSFEEFARFASRLAGRELQMDTATFESERSDAHRNLALAHLLAAYEIIDDPVEAVDHYLRQCALLVDVRDLATMAAVLANGGVHPDSGERLMAEQTAIQVLSVMTTCGMYDAAGDWVTTVGIPAKSGVGGGLIGALPGQLGVATFSPRLDKHGHSVRGVEMFNRLSSDMGLHLMELAPPSASVLRKVRTFYDNGRSTIVFQLQGSLGFTTAERVVSAVVETDPQTERVVFDIERITSIATPGRVMLLEVIRRLADNGHEVLLLDPHNVLPSAHADQSGVVRVVQTRKELQDG